MSQIAEVTVSSAYTAAREKLAYYIVQDPGTLRISGETRIEYLQRQSTNDLSLLTPQHAVPNILTSASGRILEVFTLVQDDDGILLLTQPGHAAGLAAYFKKHLFFNDHVSIEDRSAAWAQLELHGPQAAAALAALAFASAPALDEVLQIDFSGQPLRAIGEEGFVGSIEYKLLVPAAAVEGLINRLKNLGAEPLDFETREILRVEAGKAGDPEFTDANTPFEIGLDRYVSADKGCYTGQEVLARQVTYDKVVRHLAKLTAQQAMPVGSAVQADGKTIGTVSSAASSTRLGHLALAVLRKPYGEFGTALEMLAGGQTISAKVV
jgi:folate-binding protein YgfZ